MLKPSTTKYVDFQYLNYIEFLRSSICWVESWHCQVTAGSSSLGWLGTCLRESKTTLVQCMEDQKMYQLPIQYLLNKRIFKFYVCCTKYTKTTIIAKLHCPYRAQNAKISYKNSTQVKGICCHLSHIYVNSVCVKCVRECDKCFKEFTYLII